MFELRSALETPKVEKVLKWRQGRLGESGSLDTGKLEGPLSSGLTGCHSAWSPHKEDGLRMAQGQEEPVDIPGAWRPWNRSVHQSPAGLTHGILNTGVPLGEPSARD